MFKWFRDCKTAEAGKELYRKLAKQFHPDNGGDAETLKSINAEFKIWHERFKNIHTNSDGQTYTDSNGTTETAEDFIEIIRNLSTLRNISVEMCGRWLWITGNTYPVRADLVRFGCRWSAGKKKWYWTKDPYLHTRHTRTMNQIRMRYGSKRVNLNPQPVLE